MGRSSAALDTHLRLGEDAISHALDSSAACTCVRRHVGRAGNATRADEADLNALAVCIADLRQNAILIAADPRDRAEIESLSLVLMRLRRRCATEHRDLLSADRELVGLIARHDTYRARLVRRNELLTAGVAIDDAEAAA